MKYLAPLIEMFKFLTPAQAVALELREAEFALLRAESGAEYANALIAFNKNRVKRLKVYLSPLEPKETA